MVDQPRDWYCSPSNHVATKHSASWLYPISQNVIYIYTVHITSDNRTWFRYTAKEMCAVPGMPTLKLVNVTFLLVVHLKVCLSSVLERPVQKYFSGLKPTKLTKRAFSYLHENMKKQRDELWNYVKINPKFYWLYGQWKLIFIFRCHKAKRLYFPANDKIKG